MNNKVEITFKDLDTEQKIIMSLEDTKEEKDNLKLSINTDPPIQDPEQDLGLIGSLAELLLKGLYEGNESV